MPTAAQLAAFGFRASDYAHEVVTYWPDTRQAVELFIRVGTQWRAGFAGPTGLDYPAIYPLMDRLGLAPRDWDDLLHDLQVMETEALEAMHQKDDE